MKIKFRNRCEISPGLFSSENEIMDLEKSQAENFIKSGVAALLEDKQNKKVDIKDKRGSN